MFGFDQRRRPLLRTARRHAARNPRPSGIASSEALDAYHPDLKVDYLNGYDMRFSDHASFWDQKIGALEVLENYSYNGSSERLQRDARPQPKLPPHQRYHRSARPGSPDLPSHGRPWPPPPAWPSPWKPALLTCQCSQLHRPAGQVSLTWMPLPGAAGYQVYRSVHGCSDGWEPAARTETLRAGRTARSARDASTVTRSKPSRMQEHACLFACVPARANHGHLSARK